MPSSQSDAPARIRPISDFEDHFADSVAAPATSQRNTAIIVAGLVAGLAYCSWPLGFILNPALAGRGLASDLEAHSQPFYWLFILLDCVTGAATIIAARYAWPHRGLINGRMGRVALVFYALFGITTAIDALIPINCGSTSLRSCGADLMSLNVDDVLTGLAVFTLFVAAVVTQICFVRDRSWALFPVGSLVLIVVWSGLGLYYLAEHFSQQPVTLLQHLMLTMTSVVAFTTMLVTSTQLRLPRKLPADNPDQSERGVGASSRLTTSSVAGP